MKLIRQTPSRRVWLMATCLLGCAILWALPWRVTGQAPAASPQAQGASEATVISAQAPTDLKAAAASPEAKPKSHNDSLRPATDMQVFPLKYANAEEVASHLQMLNLDRAVTIVADRRTSAVIVQAPREEMGRVTDLIQRLDAEIPGSGRTAESATRGRSIAIVARRPGFVQDVFVTPGATVKEGDPLVQLEDVETEARLNNALAQLDIFKAALMIQEAEAKGVRREYDQFKVLAREKTVSPDALDAKKTAVEIAEARILKAHAEVKLAEQQVKLTKMQEYALTIRAPKGGTVAQMRVQPGEYVAGPSSQPLMMINP